MNYSNNSIRFIVLILFLVSFFFSCKTELWQSTDFTKENDFTPGIEGPAVDKDGYLYAVNYNEEGTIGKVNEKGEGEVFLKLPNNSIGNGIRFNKNGEMFIADYVGHTVYQVKKGTNTPVVWAQNPEMSQPNDLTISPNGTIYLSDPNWAENTGRIWMVTSEKKIVLLEEDMGTTNGIEVDPTGKFLYVNESNQRNVWRYDILANGWVSNKTKFINFEDFGMDGMRCDTQGNLYITRYGKGTVVIVSPEGKITNEIPLKGKKPSNLTFGGKGGKTCYVTLADRGCIEAFQVKYPGAYYTSIH